MFTALPISIIVASGTVEQPQLSSLGSATAVVIDYIHTGLLLEKFLFTSIYKTSGKFYSRWYFVVIGIIMT